MFAELPLLRLFPPLVRMEAAAERKEEQPPPVRKEDEKQLV